MIGSVGPESKLHRSPACAWCGKVQTSFLALHLLVHRAQGHPVARMTNQLLIATSIVDQMRADGIRIESSPVHAELVPGVSGQLVPLSLVRMTRVVANQNASFCPTCRSTQTNETSEVNLLSASRGRATVAVAESDIVDHDPVFWIGYDRIGVRADLLPYLQDAPDVRIEPVEIMAGDGTRRMTPGGETSAWSASHSGIRDARPVTEPVSGRMPPLAPMPGGGLPALPPLPGLDPTPPPRAGTSRAMPPPPVDDDGPNPFLPPMPVSDDDTDLPPDIAPIPRGGTWGPSKMEGGKEGTSKKTATSTAPTAATPPTADPPPDANLPPEPPGAAPTP
ncbi:MAG: hypothetical protein AB7K09_06420 [Planctomycetota bacterium]